MVIGLTVRVWIFYGTTQLVLPAFQHVIQNVCEGFLFVTAVHEMKLNSYSINKAITRQQFLFTEKSVAMKI